MAEQAWLFALAGLFFLEFRGQALTFCLLMQEFNSIINVLESVNPGVSLGCDTGDIGGSSRPLKKYPFGKHVGPVPLCRSNIICRGGALPRTDLLSLQINPTPGLSR